jgi:hypothetical protein
MSLQGSRLSLWLGDPLLEYRNGILVGQITLHITIHHVNPRILQSQLGSLWDIFLENLFKLLLSLLEEDGQVFILDHGY